MGRGHDQNYSLLVLPEEISGCTVDRVGKFRRDSSSGEIFMSGPALTVMQGNAPQRLLCLIFSDCSEIVGRKRSRNGLRFSVTGEATEAEE